MNVGVPDLSLKSYQINTYENLKKFLQKRAKKMRAKSEHFIFPSLVDSFRKKYNSML
jgi:hypothetical protein